MKQENSSSKPMGIESLVENDTINVTELEASLSSGSVEVTAVSTVEKALLPITEKSAKTSAWGAVKAVFSRPWVMRAALVALLLVVATAAKPYVMPYLPALKAAVMSVTPLQVAAMLIVVVVASLYYANYNSKFSASLKGLSSGDAAESGASKSVSFEDISYNHAVVVDTSASSTVDAVVTSTVDADGAHASVDADVARSGGRDRSNS